VGEFIALVSSVLASAINHPGMERNSTDAITA